MSRHGLLVIISGFSGAGKGTIVNNLMKTGKYRLSISATTRSPREGEQDGREYFFISRKDFQQGIMENRFLEWAEFSGNFYGTPREYVMEQIKEGCDVILEIEPQGALQVKRKFPEARLIFLTAPSMSILKERLTGRGTETEEQVARRLSQARREIEKMHEYDYIVVNEDVAECTDKVEQIIEVMHERSCQKQDLISRFREEAKLMNL